MLRMSHNKEYYNSRPYGENVFNFEPLFTNLRGSMGCYYTDFS